MFFIFSVASLSRTLKAWLGIYDVSVLMVVGNGIYDVSELTSGRKLEFQHYYAHKTAIHLCTGFVWSVHVCPCVYLAGTGNMWFSLSYHLYLGMIVATE